MGTGMQGAIAVVAILVASVAAAEEPEVQARLEAAAAAAATLERVLGERQAAGEPRCPEGDCRPGRTDRRQPGREHEASRNDAASAGEQGGGGMGGMGMHLGGMGRRGKLGGMREPKSPTAARGDSANPSTP